MKCTKITLKNRNELSKNQKNKSARQDQSAVWFTTGYHGYSYKLSARTRGHMSPAIEPQLTITTLIFPDDTTFNTGASMERWSKKTPRLTSAKTKNQSPRKSMLDDEYDFSYEISHFLEEDKQEKSLEDFSEAGQEHLALDFNEYYVSSDIEELMMKSQTAADTKDKRRKRGEKNEEPGATKKRNKFKKTIRFSFSKPPSPETEQVIRVDVTSNVSFEEMSQLENARANCNSLKTDCSKGHGKLINETVRDSSARKFDNNNNESGGDLSNEGLEEDFIVKCRQLALTQKKL